MLCNRTRLVRSTCSTVADLNVVGVGLRLTRTACVLISTGTQIRVFCNRQGRGRLPRLCSNSLLLESFRCFTPGGSESKTGECNTIDFVTGATRLFPVKGVDICSEVPEIEQCIFQDMVNIAKNISMEVGVYIRVDMFVSASGTIRVQEFSTNHINGLRHCSAKLLPNGCIDSCFLGRMWKALASNTTLGGSLEPIPSGLLDFLALSSDIERSLLAVNTVSADPVVESGWFLEPSLSSYSSLELCR